MIDIVEKELKGVKVRYSGRSSDYISPTLIQGCFGNCIYCYAARHNPDEFYNTVKVSTNLDDILEKIESTDTSEIIKPNQTHDNYITWDIACNADIVPALHLFDWEKVFRYFKYSDRDFATFATKFVNPKLLTYSPHRKVRVRMSLMPERLSSIIEPNTAPIAKRIAFMNDLYNAGYDVHVNFSPIVFYKGWREDYIELFRQINGTVDRQVQMKLACEVIFLTHNEELHKYNELLEKKGEKLLWNNSLQEKKISKFGGDNVRYKKELKPKLIREFKEILSGVMPYCKIRYIF